MNSDSDSDWDSMSEAPKPPLGGVQQGLIIYPPAPPVTNKQGIKQRQDQPPKSAVRGEKSLEDGSSPGDGGHEGGQEGGQNGVKAGTREYSVSRDSGIDTNTVASSNITASGSTMKSDSHFTDIAGEGTHQAYDSTEDSTPVHVGVKEYPAPEERINLLTFEEIKTQYFQIQFSDDGLYVDRILPTLADCWSRCMSELLGIIKIPMIIIFVLIGLILKTIISSVIKPFSDFILKPILVSCHNHLISPVFSLFYNVSRMTAMVISPCCPLQRLPSPWAYVTDVSTSKHSNNLTV